MRDALAATDMQTFYGPVKFDETGKNTAKPMVLYQIQDGQYKVVAPAEWAAAELDSSDADLGGARRHLSPALTPPLPRSDARAAFAAGGAA